MTDPRPSTLRQPLALAITLALGLAAGDGRAAVFEVSSTADDANDPTTLRGAVVAANGNGEADVIMLPEGTFVLSAAPETGDAFDEDDGLFGDLDVLDDLQIVGAGADLTVIDANALDRVLDVPDTGGSVRLLLRDLTLANGYLLSTSFGQSQGAGLRLRGFYEANIEGVEIRNNLLEGSSFGGGIAAYGGGGYGGASLVIENSTIAENNGQYGGGIAHLGGGQLEIRNSTLADNSHPDTVGFGAGLWYSAFGDPQPVGRLVNVTVTGNAAYGNPGIYIQSPLELQSSLVAGNVTLNVFSPGDLNDPCCSAEIDYSGSNNVIGFQQQDAGSFTDGVNGNQVGTEASPLDPRTAALADNGGSTRTVAIAADSPAFNSGANPDGLDFDQRGQGFARVVGPQVDVGAFELGPAIFADDFEADAAP